MIGFSVRKDSHNKEVKGNLSTGWVWYELPLNRLISAVKKGYAINTAKLSDGKRNDANYLSSQLVIVDIDNKGKQGGKDVYKPVLTIDQAIALPFIQKHCLYGYTSFSHTSEWHKFRLIFSLDQPIDDVAIAKRVIRHAAGNVPGCDSSAMSATNIFFGNTNAQDLLVNPSAESINLSEILGIFAESDAVVEEQRSQRQRRIDRSDNGDPVSKARHYLSFIKPGRADDYGVWISVGMALKTVSDELFVDWVDWSSRHGAFKGSDDCYKHWRGSSFTRKDSEHELAKLGKWSIEDGRPKADQPLGKSRKKLERTLTLEADVPDNYESPQSNKVPAAKRIYNGLKPDYGAIIAWNELTQRVEINRQEVDLSELRAEIAIKGNGTNPSPQEDFFLAMAYMAKENRYHPIKDYFKACSDSNSDLDRETCLAIFEQVLLDCLNVQATALHKIFIKRFLTNAVGRILDPGFKVDTMLVLQGKQGSRKSTFCKTLCQESSWFTDSLVDIENKDSFSLIRNRWMVELAELERFTHGKTPDGVFKVFLSKASDDYRETYGREIVSIARNCVFVGTVNRVDFLKDPTGSRRFHIISGVDRVDIEWLERFRDLVWAAAAYMYRVEPKPTSEEEELLKEVSSLNSLFEADSSWEIAISQFLTGFADQTITTKGILVDCLKFKMSEIRRFHEMEVADIMTRLQWQKTVKKDGSRTFRCWEKP